MYPTAADIIQVLDWPPLSPIEHIWDEQGRRIKARRQPPRNVIELTNTYGLITFLNFQLDGDALHA